MANVCDQQNPNTGYYCTRDAGHAGYHVALAGDNVVDVWKSERLISSARVEGWLGEVFDVFDGGAVRFVAHDPPSETGPERVLLRMLGSVDAESVWLPASAWMALVESGAAVEG